MHSALTVPAAFLLGGGLGVLATRQGSPLARLPWRLIIRIQILLISTALSIVSMWRLNGLGDLVTPALLEGTSLVAFLWALASKRERSSGLASLEAWATSPNTGFWALPLAAMLLSPAAAVTVVLADRMGAIRFALSTHLLRRDAPRPQKTATAWVDQAPLLAVLVGLGLRLEGPAPTWTVHVVNVAGPILAATGSFLFVSSVRLLPPIESDQADLPRAPRRVTELLLVRGLALLVVALAVPSAGALAALFALSAPPFMPPQFSLLYGYRSAAEALAMRVGWVLAPIGLVAALLLS